jgi:uncharacterized membrane protein
MNSEIPSVHEEIYSSATIKGHPIHPMVVGFPIASLVGVFVSDLVYLLTNDSFWPRASYYLLIGGIITGIGAAIFGATDFLLNSKIRRLKVAWLHAAGNLVLMFFAVINLVLRSQNMIDALLPWGLILSFLCVVLLTVAGWYGGELVFHHLVGLDSRNKEKVPDEKSPQETWINRVDLS